MPRSDEDREFRLRPAKPRVTRNEGAAWSNGFKLLMHHARSSRRFPNRAHSGKGKAAHPQYQRCAVRVTYQKNRVRGQWKAHGRYLERENAAKQAFSSDGGALEISSRLQQWQAEGDRQFWKMIISPEFGDRVDLEHLTRGLVCQMEKDLGTELEWIAVEHNNTEHPHIHVVMRGLRKDGDTLRFSREYVQQGIRGIAADLCTRQLGYRTEMDAAEAETREVAEKRFTSIDRRLLSDANELIVIRDANSRRRNDTSRLAVLCSMGLAQSTGPNSWRLRPDFEQVLRAMQRTIDRQRTLAAHGAAVSDPRLPIQVLNFKDVTAVEGRVLVHGQEEQTGRGYLMLEGIDAKVHYIQYTPEIEQARSRGALRPNSFVRLRQMPDTELLDVVDLGDAEKLLRNEKEFRRIAAGIPSHRTATGEHGFGGWLGRYQAALKSVRSVDKENSAPFRRRSRDLGR